MYYRFVRARSYVIYFSDKEMLSVTKNSSEIPGLSLPEKGFALYLSITRILPL